MPFGLQQQQQQQQMMMNMMGGFVQPQVLPNFSGVAAPIANVPGPAAVAAFQQPQAQAAVFGHMPIRSDPPVHPMPPTQPPPPVRQYLKSDDNNNNN